MEKHEQYTFYFGRERLKKPERKRKGQRDNEEDAKENQKRWLTHVCRMKGERLQKAALKYKLTWEKDVGSQRRNVSLTPGEVIIRSIAKIGTSNLPNSPTVDGDGDF